MTFTLRIEVDTRRFDRLMKNHRDRLIEAFVRGLNRAAEIVVKAAKLNLTGNNSIGFGVLRASIGHKVDRDMMRVTIGPGLSARPSSGNQNPRNYGIFVEEGRRPGKAPPEGALDLWVKRKLGAGDEEDVERLAILIGRKIARSGTQPAPFLVPALRNSEAQITKRIDRELDDEVQRINSGRRRR